ncbi:MAG: hypothetical protein RCG15_01775 [Candidatus Rickettsia vulgarisii]
MADEMDSDKEELYDGPYYIETKDSSNFNNKIERQTLDKERLDIIVIITSSVAKNFMSEISVLKGHITEVIIIYDDGNKEFWNLDNFTKNLKISHINTNELTTHLNALLNDEFPYRGVEINGINIQQEVTGELLGENSAECF